MKLRVNRENDGKDVDKGPSNEEKICHRFVCSGDLFTLNRADAKKQAHLWVHISSGNSVFRGLSLKVETSRPLLIPVVYYKKKQSGAEECCGVFSGISMAP